MTGSRAGNRRAQYGWEFSQASAYWAQGWRPGEGPGTEPFLPCPWNWASRVTGVGLRSPLWAQKSSGDVTCGTNAGRASDYRHLTGQS